MKLTIEYQPGRYFKFRVVDANGQTQGLYHTEAEAQTFIDNVTKKGRG